MTPAMSYHPPASWPVSHAVPAHMLCSSLPPALPLSLLHFLAVTLPRVGQPHLLMQVWAEVYIGSSAGGRWLHVDGLLGCYDQPGVVEAAVVRRQPLSYVVACHKGAPKDVTRR